MKGGRETCDEYCMAWSILWCRGWNKAGVDREGDERKGEKNRIKNSSTWARISKQIMNQRGTQNDNNNNNNNTRG